MSVALLNKIVVSDCFEYLDKIEDSFADLAVIDPPYNLKKGAWDTFGNQEEFMKFTQDWIDALIPKLKDKGSIYIFNTPFNAAFMLRYLMDKGLCFQNWITWDKKDGFSYAKRKFCQNQEAIIFFTKSNKHTFNYNAVRLPYESTGRMRLAAKKGILKNGKRWYPNPDGKLCGDVWHIVSERHRNKIQGRIQVQPHATIKPLEMIERIILASSNKNDVVLDCFVGSGTTALASQNLSRNFLCCDSDKDFVLGARKRLKENA